MQTLTPDDVKTALKRGKHKLGKDPILIALRVEMARQNITASDLAERCKVAAQTIRNVANGSNRRPGIRKKIERALGLPLWTPREEWKQNETQEPQRYE